MESKPYTCPVCNGSGQVPFEFYNPPAPHSTSITAPAGPTTCRSCGGAGVLWPPQENTYTFQNGGVGFTFDWNDLVHDEHGAFTGHVTVQDSEGNTVGEADVDFTPPVEPAVSHEDLRVEQDITDDAYTFRLLNPDGSKAAPDLVFHKGSPESGWHGWTTAKVLAALIAHMEYHQRTAFRCDENQVVLRCLQAAHRAQKIRSDRREERGVRYDWRKP